ncbi:hypothetical protein C8T65DRAFT_744092 [Cerioporus squamosus]|nr:hypothetical protein C8T65DRAFT_744092 [Cerioporus squamosus]
MALVSQMLWSSSSMHRALTCVDILEELVHHIEAMSNRLRKLAAHRIMARLACVCSAFNEFFIKKLYRTLPFISSLLRVLPTLEAVEFPQPSGRKEYYILASPIAPEDWSRFLYLASMVRRVSGMGSIPVAPSVWTYLAIALAGKPLLPSLKELFWRPRSSIDVELALLATPTLRKLTLGLRELDPNELPSWLVGLRTLLCTVIPKVPSLSEFHIDRLAIVNLSALRTLSGMASLSTLNLSMDFSDDAFPDFSGFSNLLSISLVDGKSVAAKTVLKLLATLSLKTVVDIAFVGGRDEPWLPHELLSWIHQSDALDAAIAPLTRLHTLRRAMLDITSDPPMSVTDNIFQTFAAAWPRIVSLRLFFPDATGEVSPAILVAFANACPELRELSLAALQFPQRDVGDVSAYPIRSHDLQILRVRRADVPNEQICALIVDRLFPNIDIDASIKDISAPPLGPEWEKVLDNALRFCQQSRRNRQSARAG